MIITAKVKTKQPVFRIEKGGVWVISVKAPPEKNRANAEIIKELSKVYGVVRILSGLKSSRKRILLE